MVALILLFGGLIPFGIGIFTIHHLVFVWHCFEHKYINKNIWFIYLFIPLIALIVLYKDVHLKKDCNPKKNIKVTKSKDGNSWTIKLKNSDGLLVVNESDNADLLEALRIALNERMVK